ncbi:MAG: carboxypeptidase-like regulatory domain-containing protein, partial [Candidatus Electryonea clarkiae]|nr:carboxypeptidase-like regulatory domain-containing protein [Candidatus Electryonea clarkiae]
MQRIKFFVTLGLICIFGASGLLFAEPASHDASAWPVIPTEERFSELDEPYFLIIQDTNPWGRNDIQTYLGEQEYDYDLINVNSIANTDFSEYTVVMITSAQSTQFYTTLSNNMDQFDDYISGGGWLEFHGATQGGSWELWDGTANFFATSPTNTVEDDEHPIVQSINATITGTSASHDYLTDLPDDANIIMENAIGEPVLVEYAYGAGNVLISTQTLEFYANQAGAANCGPIMFDMIDYAAEFGGVPPDGTLEGIVTDSETDDPIEGAEVVSGRSTDTTDVDGYYYLAEVSSGEGRRVRINHLYYFPYEVDTLVLDVGENEIDFAIDILSADITGIITDELTEELLMGVTVLCINAETGDIYREVTTNDTGGYVAPALHHGVTYRVVASMTGYAPSDTLDITIDWEREYTEDFELTPIFERTVRQLQQEQDPETWVTCTGVVTQGTNVT